MSEGDWLGGGLPSGTATAAPRGLPPRFELRPLSLGEVLDRSFTLYRSRFALFAGISMAAAAVHTLIQALNLTAMQRVLGQAAHVPGGSIRDSVLQMREFGVYTAGTYGALLLFFLVSAITQAAIAYALVETYLGRPVDAAASLRQVLPRWYRWIGIAAWQAWSMVWLPLCLIVPAAVLLARLAGSGHDTALGFVAAGLLILAILGALPAGVVLYLRNALAIPAAAIEGVGIRTAMRRSKRLSAGTKGRVFLVLFLASCMLQVVGMLEVPLGILMLRSPHESHVAARVVAMLITFLGHTVVAPVAAIGLTLLYVDQRVRQEAFDVEVLLEEARGATGNGSGTPGAPPPPEIYAPRP